MTMTTRRIMVAAALLCGACDNDTEPDARPSATFDASGAPTIDGALAIDGGLPDDASADGTPAVDAGLDAAATAAPVISQVSWNFPPSCTAGTASNVMISTDATDADTAGGQLVYAGSVTGCTGTIASANASVSCPNVAPYAGSVTVSDPEGNSDTLTFTINICTDGSAP